MSKSAINFSLCDSLYSDVKQPSTTAPNAIARHSVRREYFHPSQLEAMRLDSEL